MMLKLQTFLGPQWHGVQHAHFCALLQTNQYTSGRRTQTAMCLCGITNGAPTIRRHGYHRTAKYRHALRGDKGAADFQPLFENPVR